MNNNQNIKNEVIVTINGTKDVNINIENEGNEIKDDIKHIGIAEENIKTDSKITTNNYRNDNSMKIVIKEKDSINCNEFNICSTILTDEFKDGENGNITKCPENVECIEINNNNNKDIDIENINKKNEMINNESIDLENNNNEHTLSNERIYGRSDSSSSLTIDDNPNISRRAYRSFHICSIFIHLALLLMILLLIATLINDYTVYITADKGKTIIYICGILLGLLCLHACINLYISLMFLADYEISRKIKIIESKMHMIVLLYLFLCLYVYLFEDKNNPIRPIFSFAILLSVIYYFMPLFLYIVLRILFFIVIFTIIFMKRKSPTPKNVLKKLKIIKYIDYKNYCEHIRANQMSISEFNDKENKQVDEKVADKEDCILKNSEQNISCNKNENNNQDLNKNCNNEINNLEIKDNIKNSKIEKNNNHVKMDKEVCNRKLNNMNRLNYYSINIYDKNKKKNISYKSKNIEDEIIKNNIYDKENGETNNYIKSNSFYINIENENYMCAICFVDYLDDDSICVLPCNYMHYYHKDCIFTWLKKNNDCPLCRKNITI
ncbi:RING zinc finger protein, putative [Plasmodium berghei]|uniref:RING zinc finger protein, putative n=2 Tax=Plasmodium berghei TaxID=5821 RepID=A0A509ANS5_PLABA|nr:RING zinc finger protein, putative [Plasmodium berghei ANKA]CXI56467.1 RING zinc finger protein, putative [Plasmodium berghei]SCL95363.1 RING zinc finger protein, putative [Plasmodium berghei]SCM16240.1 RING zinc finger protein, putative [Plasmodium berghei]SCM18036.1 RING zinc finger protein, putative [Plasmodium berghei]SCN26471.1 RING zinc finger protein, putative [Plasmodium berghei]|eukprot:XP_034422164.1 RING zinc finger protein, putative [Plasmodium berghei ANKA]